MHKYLLAGLMVAAVSPVYPDELNLEGTGHYKLGEYDSQASGLKMAELRAFDSMISKANERMMAVKSVDKNGYYTRASWLVNAAMVSTSVVSKSIDSCPEKNGICATVTIKGILDTEQAEVILSKIYSDTKLMHRLDEIIESEAVRERELLTGTTVDVAEAKERQAKRKQILDYIAGRTTDKTLGAVDLTVINGLVGENRKADMEDISDESLLMEYQHLLNDIKEQVKIDVVSQTGIRHDDGTGGIRMRIRLSGDALEVPIGWVAEQLGGSTNWYAYSDKRPSGSGWIQKVRSVKKWNETFNESVIVGLDNDESYMYPQSFAIQLGFDRHLKQGQRKEPRPDWELDQDKLKLIEDLSQYSVCIYFTLGVGEPVKRCIAGGKDIDKSGRDYITRSWDINAPYLWFAKDKSEFNVFMPIDKDLLRDQKAMAILNYSYRVVVSKNEEKRDK